VLRNEAVTSLKKKDNSVTLKMITLGLVNLITMIEKNNNNRKSLRVAACNIADWSLKN
jgi:hypothetical protein